MDVKKYLERIGIGDSVNLMPSYELLKLLQLSHLYSVPYENLDIIKGVPLCSDIQKVYEKVVLGRRGGWCFELNALFAKLLRELGFTTQNYLARFWRGDRGRQVPQGALKRCFCSRRKHGRKRKRLHQSSHR